MKRNLCSFLLLLFVNFTNAQLTTVWEKSAGSSYTWFTTSSGNTTGCAYNPVTNKLLVADRSNLIAVINVTTGNSEGTLITTPFVGTEAYKWNKIRITDDGVIYGVSLATTSPYLCKIYRWESQTANPTLCASFNANERCGDAFGLSGSGTSTVLYVSGNGITSSAVNIYMLTTANGTDFTLNSTINVPMTGANAWAGRSVDPITTGTSSDLWIRSQNTNTRRISSTGAVLYTSTDGSGVDQVKPNYSNARYFTSSDGSKFLALVGTSSDATGGRKLKVLNVTDEAAVTLVDTSELTNTFNTNTSGIGDVAVKDNGDGSFVLFYLITNNGVMAVSTSVLLPATISSFKGKVLNNTVALHWSTSNEINNMGFEIERSDNGIQFLKIGYLYSKAANGSSSNNIDYTFNDVKILAGRLYYRLKQLNKDGKFEYSKVVHINNSKVGLTASLLNNPIKDKITLNIYSNKSKFIAINIFDANGKKLFTRQQKITIDNNTVEISTASFTKGILLINISTKEDAKTITLKAIHQ